MMYPSRERIPIPPWGSLEKATPLVLGGDVLGFLCKATRTTSLRDASIQSQLIIAWPSFQQRMCICKSKYVYSNIKKIDCYRYAMLCGGFKPTCTTLAQTFTSESRTAFPSDALTLHRCLGLQPLALPKINIHPEIVVGRLLSFWQWLIFQGRAVKLREGNKKKQTGSPKTTTFQWECHVMLC